ncbi:MAG: RNA polymerase sigma factor [Bacteroidales bacterium]|jgi:RNA polymerase sigma-70 factor (ECF subfamily)|nr:RNA polymerase sigma factor [Bacteroidales bacterium]
MTANEYNSCVNQYSDGVYRFVLKHIKDTDRTSDVVQDAFLKMWEKVETISFDTAKSYLFTAAHHTLVDEVRKGQVHQRYVDAQPLQTFSTQNMYSDVYEVLNKAMELLPADQKSVIMLRDYEGYSYDEIAQITGLNESQVKVYIFRARTFLKNYIVQIENLI